MAELGVSTWATLFDTGIDSPAIAATDPIAAAYRTATDRLTAQRAALAAAIFIFFVGNGSVLEWWFFPERRWPLLVVCTTELLLCAIHVAATQQRPALLWPITVLVYGALAACISWYFARVGGSAEMLAVALALFLSGTAVVYPWGARGQALCSAGAVLVYVWTLVTGTFSHLPLLYNTFTLVTAASITTFGAHLLDRHRWLAFRHAAELQHANAQQRQETLISQALLSLAETLNATLSNPRATAERLTEHSRAALGFDWTATSLLDETRQVFRTVAVNGSKVEILDEVRTVELPCASVPIRELSETQGCVEIVDRDQQNLVPRTLLERWNVRSLLATAIVGGDHMIGILMGGYNERHGPFSDMQHRLLKGFAQHAAVALENARSLETVQEASRTKSEFVATVSHELRTPLNVIVGYTDLMLDRELGDITPQQQDALQRVRTRSLHLVDLVQDILDINRIESGRVPVTFEDFSVGEVLQGVRSGIPTAWRRPPVQLDFDTTHDHVVLRSDRAKLETILRNLIHNALKYTEQGRVSLSVSTRPSTHAVEFSVRDTGGGIPQEELPRIFEIFHQVHSNGHLSEGGVGLGLYIVRRLVDALGGTVSVHSTVGQGSEFIISLPLEPTPAVALRDAAD